MTYIRSNDEHLLYCFDPDDMYNDWGRKVIKNIHDRRRNSFHKTFHFEAKDWRNIPEEEWEPDKEYYCEFILGVLENNFYRIDRSKLGLNHDLYIQKDLPIKMSFFIAKKGIPIMPKIDKIVNQEVYICKDILVNTQSIPYTEFSKLLKSFPNSRELLKYSDMRIGSILKNYFDKSVDVISKYNSFMEKKSSSTVNPIRQQFVEYEIAKLEAIYERLKKMLDDEDEYSESIWQSEILSIILLLYPKYIKVFEKTPFTDTLGRKRQLDFLLLDFNGYLDIVEIKKPFEQAIVTDGKYRDNHIPLRELSGTVMQIEKYIYYLSKKGVDIEKSLTKKYQEHLPANFEIKITNPGGMIIMGRDNKLSPNQKEDFEIIKRKYKSVLDIITYDDLLRRLEFSINMFKIKQ